MICNLLGNAAVPPGRQAARNHSSGSSGLAIAQSIIEAYGGRI